MYAFHGMKTLPPSDSTQIGLSALRPGPSQQYAERKTDFRLRPPPLTLLQDGGHTLMHFNHILIKYCHFAHSRIK